VLLFLAAGLAALASQLALGTVLWLQILALVLAATATFCLTRRRALRAVASLAVVIALAGPPFVAKLEREARSHHGPELAARESLDWRVTHRVKAFEARGFAILGERTSEIIPPSAGPAIQRSFPETEAPVLYTAVGIDPLAAEALEGRFIFSISVGQESKPLLTETIVVGPEAHAWRSVEIDLSHRGTGPHTLVLTKRFEGRGGDDLSITPTDLALWRRPTVRPGALPGRPNLILISLDTFRADHMGLAGYRRDTTPTLDALARRSAVFTTAVTQAPWTRPAHLSLMTGTHPSTHGGDDPKPDSPCIWDGRVPPLAELLRERGYRTAAFTAGGSVAARFGFYRGFDFYDENREEAACWSDIEETFGRAQDWLEANAQRSFFLFLHTYEPHAPYCDDHFVRQEGIPPTDVLAHRTALYDGDLRRTDAELGRVLDRLGRLGLTENSIIVITSDHGEDLGGRMPPETRLQNGHGHNLYDELLRVPLLIHGPKVPQGVRVSQQVRSIDIAPTVMELLGFEAPEVYEGESLIGLMAGRPEAPRLALSEATSYGPARESLRSAKRKYVRRLSDSPIGHEGDDTGVPLGPPHELYDLVDDPGERRNLAGDRLTEVEEMRRAMGAIRAAAPAVNPVPGEAGDLEDDPALLEQLRDLGYIR